MNNTYSIILVIVVSAITYLIRSLPFLLFGGKRPVPKIITYLSEVLHPAIIGMLIIYCLRNVNIIASPHALPEIIAIAVVVALHLWKKNTILSLFVGTVLYMVLVQTVFV